MFRKMYRRDGEPYNGYDVAIENMFSYEKGRVGMQPRVEVSEELLDRKIRVKWGNGAKKEVDWRGDRHVSSQDEDGDDQEDRHSKWKINGEQVTVLISEYQGTDYIEWQFE